MKILITGASGFIGSHLTNHFCRLGHDVTAYCRTPNKISHIDSKKLILVQGFIEDHELLKYYLKDQDILIHCALGWGETATEMLTRDTLPSVALFEEAINQRTKKIIYTSSSVATGEYRNEMDENTVCRPIDAYSATKAATENYLMALSRNTQTQCNIVRPTYTFGNPVVTGASCQPDTTFKSMVEKAIANEPIEIIKNDGVQMIWIGRLVKLYEYLITHELTRSVVIAGSDRQVKWSSIAQKIIAEVRSNSRLIFTDSGWSEEGCLWATETLNELISKDQELDIHLNAHIHYLCSNLDAKRSQIELGVEA